VRRYEKHGRVGTELRKLAAPVRARIVSLAPLAGERRAATFALRAVHSKRGW